MLHLIVHFDRRIFIDGNDQALAEESAARKMMRDISCNLIQTVIALNDLQNSG